MTHLSEHEHWQQGQQMGHKCLRGLFLLDNSSTAFSISASWNYAVRGLFQCKQYSWSLCSISLLFLKERNRAIWHRSKTVPGLVQTDILTTKSQTSNLVQKCGLWKMWCDGLEERLSWNQNSHSNPTYMIRYPDHGTCLLFGYKTPGKLIGCKLCNTWM